MGNKGNDWKNCGYHMHVMQLLSAILPRLPQSERAGFTKVRASLGVSVVDFIVSAYQVKAGEVWAAAPRPRPTERSAAAARRRRRR
ncbi:MAG: hypothetical protein IPI67_07775 [Myxococcales bacterium]|nr:hypothetical protein [Myxococcales bacterium]